MQPTAPPSTSRVSPSTNRIGVCFLAGGGGPELTDELAQQAGSDATLNVTYAGTFGPLGQTTTFEKIARPV